EVNQTTYVLVGGKTNTATVNIACYLNGWDQELGNPQGLVPLPTGCGRLENMYAYELQKNPEGALLADGARLLIFDADYGPGGTMDMPPGAGGSDPDLSVPTNEVPVLKQVMAENGLEGESEGQTLQNVRRFFARRFTYTLWQRPPASQRTNETPLARFLLRTHRGHCEYFATATVLLLRQMGIPARYAVGYLVPDRGRGGSYLVRDCDAHAWCLAWDANKKQWEDFDTTPFSALNAMDLLPPWQWMADMLSNGAFEFSKYRLALQRRDWRAYLLLALIPALAFLLYRILFRHGRKQQWRKMPRPVENLAWPGLDSEFYALERKLAERGAARGAGEPLAQWIEHVLRDPTPEDFRGTLRRALELHYRHRFDPNGLTALERRQLAQEAGAGLERLAELNGRHSG
ncbi:MAG: hypothetical protein KGR98_08145, partial [Verrucomicrobia bacterium]|nr:hypothetical protein [Verrucomicrobiota bacterium]